VPDPADHVENLLQFRPAVRAFSLAPPLPHLL
jgi:hypothetical protein